MKLNGFIYFNSGGTGYLNEGVLHHLGNLKVGHWKLDSNSDIAVCGVPSFTNS